jgi:hypothetical protein
VSLVISNVSAGIPSGSYYFNYSDGCDLTFGAFTTSGGFMPATTLPVTGTYTLLIVPSVPNTGSVTLTLYNVVDITGTLTFGAPFYRERDAPGQKVQLTSSGSA